MRFGSDFAGVTKSRDFISRRAPRSRRFSQIELSRRMTFFAPSLSPRPLHLCHNACLSCTTFSPSRKRAAMYFVTYPLAVKILIQTRFSWTCGSFDIFHTSLVIIHRPSPDISQYTPSFSRYCMEMLGRGLSRRVPREADLFAVTKAERNRNRNTTVIRNDIESTIVPIFAL